MAPLIPSSAFMGISGGVPHLFLSSTWASILEAPPSGYNSSWPPLQTYPQKALCILTFPGVTLLHSPAGVTHLVPPPGEIYLNLLAYPYGSSFMWIVFFILICCVRCD